MQASQEQTPLDSYSQTIKEQHHSICQVCAFTEDDIKILLHNLLHSLASINANKVGENVPDNGGFVKQIKMIFYSKYKFSSKCTHLRVRQLFQNALGINSVQLDLLCNKKMLEMAKYSYQIDVVSQQIKTFNRHFISVSKKKKQKKNKGKQMIDDQAIKTAKSNKTKIPQEYIKPEIEMEHKVKQQYLQQEVGNTNLQIMMKQGDEKKQARTQYEQYQAPSILPNHLQMNMPTQMFSYPVTYPYVQMHGGWYVDINPNLQP